MKYLGPVLGIMCALIAGAANADSYLLLMLGDWDGRGKITTSATSPMQRSRCRATVQLDDAGNSIVMKGRCAVAAGASRFSARLVDDGDGKLRGAISSAALSESIQFSGEISSAGIDLLSRSGFLRDGLQFSAKLAISFEGDEQFQLQEWNTPEGTVDWRLVTDLQFVKSNGG